MRTARSEFVCECATSGCFERLLLTLREYEQVRADGAHFLLKPGHEDIEVEQVIARRRSLAVSSDQEKPPTRVIIMIAPIGGSA